jgi:CheY-like chemotaxis protein
LQEAALELAISERQAYRDLRQGQISVAELLWDAPVLTQERTGASLSPIQVEVERLRDNFRAVDLVGLLHMAQKVVQQLAYQYETPLNIALPDTSVTLKVNVPIAQQVLVDLLSYCIKQAQSHTLQVTLEKSDQQLKLCLRYVRHVNAADTPLRMTHIPQLTEQLKWQILQQRRQDEMVIQLVLRASRSTLMIIDDNEDLAELVARYLTGSNYDILAYDSSPEGLRRARETLPTAILLDVMMPEMNGWEFLQRLRTYPETETIPVIICSVIHDVELAYSLGASYLIPKPMTQDRLFEAFSALHLF